MNPENMEFQRQVREDAEDRQKYLLDLDNWEKEMRKKEEELKLIEIPDDEGFPPIRNSLSRSKKKSRHKKQKERNPITKAAISSYDYKKWEKFDVESELKKLDEEKKPSSASDNSDSEEELSRQKKKQLALLNKDKGNEFFKKGNFDSAINYYTTGMQLDPENPLLPANRAMAFLKKEQFQAAENDCTLCLSIDPTYVKAYLRRGTARSNLKKFSLAKADFVKALEIEPDNKQAQLELKKLGQAIESSQGDQNSELQVVKAQEFWPQFLGNKNVQRIEESFMNENSADDFSMDCIFPDAQLIDPVRNLTIPDGSVSKKSRTEVKIMKMSEEKFKELVVERDKMDIKTCGHAEMESCTCGIENIVNKLEKSLPPVPDASFQFLTDWKKIYKYPELKYKYLKQLPPEKFPLLFKHSMEADIFPEILHTLSTLFLQNGDEVFPYMKNLAAVGRFKTMLDFLSADDKKDLQKLLESIQKSDHSPSEVESLLKMYSV